MRAHGPEDDRVRRARAEHAACLRQMDQARAAVAGAKREVSARLSQCLAGEAADDLARLSTDFPVVLFPVRVETRFDVASQQGAQLKVRVYPDTILTETHDPLLTGEEYDAGTAYWQKAWTDEPQAWRELVQQARPPRAAWIVRVTEPINLDDRPDGEPSFPDVELRAQSWDRAPQTSLLPDRWVVLAYRERVELHRAVSRPVQEPLALGFDPHSPSGEGINVSGDGLELDEDFAWAVDFWRAEEAGMAVRIQLDAQDIRRGFDLVLVVGVKGSLLPEEGRDAIEQLLEGHHYCAGLAFVPQGTPTNNTQTASSPFPSSDPDGARSFAVERGSSLDTEDGDGARLMRALGLSTDVVGHVEGADRTEQVVSRAMNQALWPVTWGYFLGQMMAPHVSHAAIEEARRHFVEHVRGRGPLPAFRVGGQPYGVLPVISLDHWEPGPGATGVDVELPALLQRLRSVWRAQLDQVPRVGRTQDPDADLLAVLGMDASTREVRVRRVHGPDFQTNLLAFLAIPTAAWEEAQLDIARPAMDLIGFPAWNPRILRMNFADDAGRFRYPFVAPGPLSEETGLEAVFGFDYLQWIREATIAVLRDETVSDGRQPPKALLYRMLRHARLAELGRVAIGLQITHGLASEAELHEPELVGIADATVARPTIWQRFEQPIPAITGHMSLGEFLTTQREATEVTTLRDYDAALEALEGLPTAELQRLLTETLDLCSHRFDAWLTSLATKRLQSMREANLTGAYVGAFGWVEDLHPAPAAGFRQQTLEDGRTVQVSLANAGYIQAPSMDHAAAAAVLRNGCLTRSGERGMQNAVNLSSERVRTALSLLDAVREGQPLGAVLGYRFERGLHEGHRPLELARFIEPLRRRFPLVAHKAAESDDLPDVVAARNVVDGKALRDAWKNGSLDLGHADFHNNGQPPSLAERAAVRTELQHLEDTVDAVADLLTAESVYQTVSGNTAGANASLDAMAKGVRPPDPRIAQQPRAGIPLTHRVAIVLGGDALPAEGWTENLTPRALAEPYVDGWAAQLLGDPSDVRCRVRFTPKGDPDTTSPAEVSEVPVSLTDLKLRPIDVLALAQAVGEGLTGISELDHRIAAAALHPGDFEGRVEILYARHEGWDRGRIRTFPEVLEVARAINKLLALARPLKQADCVPPDVAALLAPTDAMADETLERAGEARRALAEVGDKLAESIVSAVVSEVTEQLRTASLYGIPGAFVASDPAGTEISELTDRATSVKTEIERRVEAAAAASDAAAIAQAVFGGGFPFLPRFTPPRTDELRLALEAGAALVTDEHAAKRWMYQAARVRPVLAQWRKLVLLAGALKTHQGTLDVVQLPYSEGARWVALPIENGAEPPAGVLSLVMNRYGSPQAEEPWVGLLLTEWSELIPDSAPTTGVAFHYDTPGGEPPQCVLIAVPPTNAQTWDLKTLTATLRETLDLAKLRAVDGELLGALGQLTPAVYLAANAANDTISTDFGEALAADRVLAP